MGPRRDRWERADDALARPQDSRPAIPPAAAAALALQRSAGNRATAAVLARARRPRTRVSAPTLQRRWLFGENPVFFFWDDDGTAMDEAELDAPEFRGVPWRSGLPGVGAPPPRPPYVVDTGNGKELVQAAGRGNVTPITSRQRYRPPPKQSQFGPPRKSYSRAREGETDTSGYRTYLDRNTYKSRYDIRAPAKRSSVFNPFGRFTAAVYSVFLNPSMTEEQRAPIVESLRRDKKFRRAAQPQLAVASGTAPGTSRPVLFSYPDGFLSEQGEEMVRAEITEFGAIYRVRGEAERLAQPDAAATNAPGDAMQLALTGGPADRKYALSGTIDAKLLDRWAGTRASAVPQTTVMGRSAAVVAANAGFQVDDPREWEWLHLIAYSLGGIGGNQPQQVGNLVAGTAECNTEMIVAEELIKSAVQRAAKDHHELMIKLEVPVKMYDPARHIAREIGYTFLLSDAKGGALAVLNFRFNALTKVKPIAGKNRMARAYGDVRFAAEFATAKRYTLGAPDELTPLRNRPHTEIDESGLPDDPERVLADFSQDPLEQQASAAIDQLAGELIRASSPQAAAAMVAGAWSKNRHPPAEVFDRLGEALAPEPMARFLWHLRQVNQLFAEPVIRRTVRAALLENRLGDQLEAVLFAIYDAKSWDELPQDVQQLRNWTSIPDYEQNLGEGPQPLPIDAAMLDDGDSEMMVTS